MGAVRLAVGGALTVLGVAALAIALLLPRSAARPPAAFSTVAVAARPAATPTAFAPPFEPDRLRIGALRIDAPVGRAYTVGHQLLPPDDPAEVGWWAGSRLAGSSHGSTVLAGHVDSATRGLGALYSLNKVKPGMLVVVSGDRPLSYRVDSLEYYPKTTGLPAGLFADGGAARLVLISCGGPFDTVSLSYRDNVVVIAHAEGQG